MDQIYKQIVQFQRKCNDYTDDRSAPIARSLQQAVQKLEDEAQAGKNPRSLDDRLKGIIRLLEEVGSESAMSQNHVGELIRQCESLQEELRRLR